MRFETFRFHWIFRNNRSDFETTGRPPAPPAGLLRLGYPPRALSSVRNPVWIELVQLVPVVSLALPFILAGQIDFTRASGALLVAALLTLPISALVVWQKGVLNPILIGTALWLWVSAVAFWAPLPGLIALLSDAQGAGLFVGVLAVGLACTRLSPEGFIGARHGDRQWILRSSWILLALSALAVGWSWALRHNIRTGGGLPFILLNVARRVIVLRAPSQPA